MPKGDFNKVACMFSEHLFSRTPLGGCFSVFGDPLQLLFLILSEFEQINFVSTYGFLTTQKHSPGGVL